MEIFKIEKSLIAKFTIRLCLLQEVFFFLGSFTEFQWSDFLEIIIEFHTTIQIRMVTYSISESSDKIQTRSCIRVYDDGVFTIFKENAPKFVWSFIPLLNCPVGFFRKPLSSRRLWFFLILSFHFTLFFCLTYYFAYASICIFILYINVKKNKKKAPVITGTLNFNFARWTHFFLSWTFMCHLRILGSSVSTAVIITWSAFVFL